MRQVADILPLEIDNPLTTNVVGLRLFAVHCAKLLGSRIKLESSWNAVRIAEQYAKGLAPLQEMVWAYCKVTHLGLQTLDLVDAACAACCAYRCETEQRVANHDTLEAGALYAARIASTVARLTLMHEKPLSVIDKDLTRALKRYVPELFKKTERKALILHAG